MDKKSEIILLQLVKALKTNQWTSDNQWELSLKADGYVPLMRSIVVNGELDGDKWKDRLHVMIRLAVTTDDEITFFPEFTVFTQIAIGSVPASDVEYKMMGNTAFTDKDLKNNKKIHEASREISRMVDNYINEMYQDYVDKNIELMRFYKQQVSQEKSPTDLTNGGNVV